MPRNRSVLLEAGGDPAKFRDLLTATKDYIGGIVVPTELALWAGLSSVARTVNDAAPPVKVVYGGETFPNFGRAMQSGHVDAATLSGGPNTLPHIVPELQEVGVASVVGVTRMKDGPIVRLVGMGVRNFLVAPGEHFDEPVQVLEEELPNNYDLFVPVHSPEEIDPLVSVYPNTRLHVVVGEPIYGAKNPGIAAVEFVTALEAAGYRHPGSSPR